MQGVWSEEDGENGGLEYSESASTGVTRLSTTLDRSENPGEGPGPKTHLSQMVFVLDVHFLCGI